jgi:hypothetical protein
MDRVLQSALVATNPRSDGLPGSVSHNIIVRHSEGWPLVFADDPGPEEDHCDGLELHLPWTRDEKLSYPGPRKWNRSLYTCAQDVQFTHVVTI